ncbi:Chaperone protein HtpG [Frankliniella fusca]|uniref:Chaperone protein HtpG n=1 Tax=Frankliniella fusca TaxID=407009 RepID=A0AAE1LBE9_9NEOP|nr:Chaperone protein HtpG [Frankliniella fusca]
MLRRAASNDFVLSDLLKISVSTKMEGPLVDRSFRLVENQNISRSWLYTQTFFYMCAALAGFACAFSLRTFRNVFSDSCLINIEFSVPKTKSVQAVYGPSTRCDYCEFVPVVASIAALVLAMFFIMGGRGGKGSPGFLPSPWRIVIPALIFNLIALGFVISATTILHNGLQKFCDQLLGRQLEMSGTGVNGTTTDIDVNPQHGFRTLTGCRVDLNQTFPADQHSPLHAITPANYALLEISQVASWCNVISWMMCASITLLRFLCLADFRLVRFDFHLVAPELDVEKPDSSSTMRTAHGESTEYFPTSDGAEVINSKE